MEKEREREIRRTSRDGFNYCCLKHLKTINQQSGSGNHSSHGQPWWFGCGHVNPSEFHSDFTTWLHNGWCSDEGNHPRPWPYDDFFSGDDALLSFRQIFHVRFLYSYIFYPNIHHRFTIDQENKLTINYPYSTDPQITIHMVAVWICFSCLVEGPVNQRFDFARGQWST